jgi:hypothetical protein
LGVGKIKNVLQISAEIRWRQSLKKVLAGKAEKSAYHIVAILVVGLLPAGEGAPAGFPAARPTPCRLTNFSGNIPAILR